MGNKSKLAKFLLLLRETITMENHKIFFKNGCNWSVADVKGKRWDLCQKCRILDV